MRTLKLTMMVALALALGAANANAASIDVIWQNSGTATTTVSSGAVITGNIVMTTGTALNGAGAGLGISSDSTGDVIMVSSSDTSAAISGWFSLSPISATGTHSAATLSSGDLFGSGAGFAANTTYTMGTITVNAGAAGGTVSLGATTTGDDIIGAANTSYLGEYSFNAGNVIVPEPTTASLLGLGLLGLSLAGRNRKN